MKNKISKSLKYSFWDGTFYALMVGFGDSYINPYAIILKATNFQIGLLSSLPGLVSSLFQLKIPDWTEKVGRTKMMTNGVFAQALVWLPILLIPFLFKTHSPAFLIALVTIYTVCGAMATPAWASIMTQYLPPNKRGRYFSWRNQVHGIITVAATFTAGFILWLFPKQSIYGFTLIFSVAIIGRLVSWHFLTKMYEPKLFAKPGSIFSFWDFISRTRQSNFAKFAIFVGLINFAVGLASPFFPVYMLRELNFDYLSYVLVMTTPTVATLATLVSWGKHADKTGCVRVMRLTTLIIPILPILWLVSSSKIYLIIIQVISGFAWAGFNLAASNFIYDAVSEEKRVRCISYFNLINGVGLFWGALLGGYIISYLPNIKASKFLTIFLISGILRIFIRFFLISKIKEVKNVNHISNTDLFFSVTGLKPAPFLKQNT